jgi:hypothetical protein
MVFARKAQRTAETAVSRMIVPKNAATPNTNREPLNAFETLR